MLRAIFAALLKCMDTEIIKIAQDGIVNSIGRSNNVVVFVSTRRQKEDSTFLLF